MQLRLFALFAVTCLAIDIPQASAAAIPYVGTLSIQMIDPNPRPPLTVIPLPPAVAAGAGVAVVSSAGSHVQSLAVPSSAFNAAMLSVPVTDPMVAGIKGIQATFHNAAGAFSGSPLAGSMALNGVTKICFFGTACSNATANLSVPLSLVGVGGTAAYPPGTTSATFNLTVRGAPWTAGTAAVGTLTQMGFQHGPASATSSTAADSGAVRLVTPIFVSTDIGALQVVPGFAFLDLHFVPEPSTLLLLGGGIAGLVMIGRTKRD
jgi:hypothetical protein